MIAPCVNPQCPDCKGRAQLGKDVYDGGSKNCKFKRIILRNGDPIAGEEDQYNRVATYRGYPIYERK